MEAREDTDGRSLRRALLPLLNFSSTLKEKMKREVDKITSQLEMKEN